MNHFIRTVDRRRLIDSYSSGLINWRSRFRPGRALGIISLALLLLAETSPRARAMVAVIEAALEDAFLQVRGAGGELAYIGGDGFGGDVQIGSSNPNVQTVSAFNTSTGRFMNMLVGLLAIAGPNAGYVGDDGFGGDVQIGSSNPNVQTVSAFNTSTGRFMNMLVGSLTITGGADLAEPFGISGDKHTPELAPGSVVVIDENNPGHLKRSERAYDTRVAGIISGAGGLNPGIQLKQEGVLEAGQNVALTGRVYALADATRAPIKPGDLLTTSNTAGHLMKVTNPEKAHGAILGKAMTTLHDGKGLVLVLVTLQ
jgi:hypothetical protein